MGRKLIYRETRLQPAEYADGFAGGKVEIAFVPRRQKDGDDGEEWARKAALLTLDALHRDYGDILESLECRVRIVDAYDDGVPRHFWDVTAKTRDLDEGDWQEDFWAEMEDWWDEDGGVTDERLAREAFGRSFEKYVRGVLCEDEEASKDDNFHVDVKEFEAWQGSR